MSKSDRINFNPGIRQISRFYPLTLTKRAQNLISTAIQEINNKLVSHCLRKFKSKNSVMKVNVAAHAVNEVCGGAVRDCAVAEANKTMLKYNSGLLHYRPKTKVSASLKAKVKAKKEKQHLGTEFSKGVMKLENLIFPDALIQTNAKKIICLLLGGVSSKISDSAKASGQQQKTITPNDVKIAVEHILPLQLAKHALTEGAKMVFLLESGGISLAKKHVVKSPFKTLKSTLKRRGVKPERLRKKKISVSLAKKSGAVRRVKETLTRKRRKRKSTSIPSKFTPSQKRRKVKRTILAPKKRMKSLVPAKKKVPSVFRRKITPSVSRKKRVPPVQRKKKSISISRKIKPSTSRKKKASSVSRKRITPAKSRKKRAPKTASQKKPTKIRVTKSPFEMLKPTRERRRTKLSRLKKKKISVSLAKKSRTARKVKETLARKPHKRKRTSTPSKVTPSPKRRKVKPTISVPKKRIKSLVATKKKPTKEDMVSKELKKTPYKKTIDSITVTGLVQGVKCLNENFEQSVSADALQFISSSLSILFERLVDAIRSSKSSNVGSKEVREAVLKVFPPQLRELALAQQSQVLMSCPILSKVTPSTKRLKVKRTISAPKKRKKRSISISRKKVKPSTSRKKTAISVSRKETAISVSRKKTIPAIPKKSRAPKTTSPKKRVAKSPVKALKPTHERRLTKPASLRKKKISVSPKKKSRAVRRIKETLPRKPRKRRITPISAKVTTSPKHRKVKRTISTPKKHMKSLVATKTKPIKKYTVTKRITKETPYKKTAGSITFQRLSQGIKDLNENFKQSLSPEAQQLISNSLSNLFERLVDVLKSSKSSNVRSKEVREAVLKVFPPELQELAVARLSQVLMSIQYSQPFELGIAFL